MYIAGTNDDVQGGICMGGIAHATIRPGVIPNGLVGYWDFTGGNSQDLSGNGLHGIDTAIVYNNGAILDGVNSYINFGNSPLLQLVTGSYFVMFSTFYGGIRAAVLFKENSYNLYMKTGRLSMISIPDANADRLRTPLNTYNDGHFYCVHINYDSGEIGEMYINGLLIETSPILAWNALNNSGNLYLPRPAQKIDGTIKTAGIYNRTLSGQEIAYLYRNFLWKYNL